MRRRSLLATSYVQRRHVSCLKTKTDPFKFQHNKQESPASWLSCAKRDVTRRHWSRIEHIFRGPATKCLLTCTKWNEVLESFFLMVSTSSISVQWLSRNCELLHEHTTNRHSNVICSRPEAADYVISGRDSDLRVNFELVCDNWSIWPPFRSLWANLSNNSQNVK